ncbi:hypothetical protein NH340_JMT02773 [Sarcoptes scabiei]|uniref:Uncharacterized protein n=1 Tax=Sarcoptes scabiei TaxID=52283 RepID=A0A132AGZ2_SARSC|nr:hypothetical protein QR98_0088120 [Sarcoptes scabiei]UXI16830.1 hypothetical protein NH340_JMT02773 [Sarcoptes scabiei]
MNEPIVVVFSSTAHLLIGSIYSPNNCDVCKTSGPVAIRSRRNRDRTDHRTVRFYFVPSKGGRGNNRRMPPNT